MDTSEYPSLPQLNQLHTILAADNQRVEAVIDSQLDSIEQLLSAVISQDWTTVKNVTRYLADLEPGMVGEDVLFEARRVHKELSCDSNNGALQPPHLNSLLAACRSVRKNRNWVS